MSRKKASEEGETLKKEVVRQREMQIPHPDYFRLKWLEHRQNRDVNADAVCVFELAYVSVCGCLRKLAYLSCVCVFEKVSVFKLCVCVCLRKWAYLNVCVSVCVHKREPACVLQRD